MDYFDKEKDYKKKIEPIINDLKFKCNIEKMPMFVTVCVKNTEEETKYRHNIIMASTGLQLTDNRINRLLLKVRGLDPETIPDHIKKAADEIEEYIDNLTSEETTEIIDDEVIETKLLEEMASLMS